MKNFKKMISAVTAGVMTCSMAVSTAFTAPANAADKTAVQLVNEMGLGWNLGNTFDCHGVSETYFGLGWEEYAGGVKGTGWVGKSTWNANSTETAWGNPVTTQAMIDAVKAEGFDTVRIPVTWFENSDPETYKIDEAYLARVKEVIDYAYNNNMYVIINMHWDWANASDKQKDYFKAAGKTTSYWLTEGMNALPQFETMWTQIATYFKDYDSHLVFEDMNEVTFDYDTLNTFNQKFVELVRKTGGNNADRLLLLAGANDDLSRTCSPEYKLPDDDMIAVSIHYYYPTPWAVATVSDPNAPGYWGYQGTWGTDADKQEVYNLFAKMKAWFADEGVPVILGEYGVVTPESAGKDHDSIVSYLDTIASSALATEGVTAVLWDAGNAGDMQYFNRTSLQWFNQDYADVYKNLRENGTDIEFEYDIKKDTQTADRAVVKLSGDPDYTVDLAPYAGKGITIKQVILKGEPGGGWGVSLPATNPDGSPRNWTSEAGQTGADGTVTIDFDGIYENDNGGKEEYVLSLGGSLGLAHWWGDGKTLESITLVFDKEISYTDMDISVVAKEKQQTEKPTEAEQPTEAPTEAEQPTETPTEAEQPTEEQAETVKLGDADLSGKVDIMDVIVVNKAILGKVKMEDKQLKAVDFNKNDKPDASDSLNIMKLIVGLVTEAELKNMN